MGEEIRLRAPLHRWPVTGSTLPAVRLRRNEGAAGRRGAPGGRFHSGATNRDRGIIPSRRAHCRGQPQRAPAPDSSPPVLSPKWIARGWRGFIGLALPGEQKGESPVSHALTFAPPRVSTTVGIIDLAGNRKIGAGDPNGQLGSRPHFPTQFDIPTARACVGAR
jgi:hypothetical protein